MHNQSRPKQAGWYCRLKDFFKNYKEKSVYKIPLDGGFTCPNRDGSISSAGCIYCCNRSFAPSSLDIEPLSITDQIIRGKKKTGQNYYLAYFQAFTNTYAPLDTLKKLYDEALTDPEVIGLSIATRPDCISNEVLNLLEEYTQDKQVWIEYGLQSAHDQTLQMINRGHNFNQFEQAVRKTQNRNILICAHIILGLPGETAEMMHETIRVINNLELNGVKFHHLQVIKNTTLAEMYHRGEVTVYEKLQDYIPIICDCLELLSPGVVVHRLASQVTDSKLLIAPCWPESAGQIALAVENELQLRGTYQGSNT